MGEVLLRIGVAAVLVTFGVLLVAHGSYQVQHPDWRYRQWWGRNRIVMFMFGGRAGDLISEALERRSSFSKRFAAIWTMFWGAIACLFGLAVLATGFG